LPESPARPSDQQHGEGDAETHRPRPEQRVHALVEGRLLVRRIQQHHHEQEEHHDRAGVHDDLDDRDKGRVEQHVEARQRAKGRNQQQHAVDRIALRDDQQRGGDGHRAEQVEGDDLRRQSTTPPPPSRAG
jgi:hypothetical protein